MAEGDSLEEKLKQVTPEYSEEEKKRVAKLLRAKKQAKPTETQNQPFEPPVPGRRRDMPRPLPPRPER